MARQRRFYDKQFFVLNVTMFNTDVGVAINMDERDVLGRLRKVCSNPELLKQAAQEMSGWDDDAGHAEGRMCKMGGGFFVLLRLRKGYFRRAAAILTHEMVHVTQYLLRDRRVPLSQDTEEVHAYLTEHLVEQSLRRLYT